MVGRLLVLIAAVLLAGCGSTSSTTSSAAEAPVARAEEVRQRASNAALTAFPNSVAPGGTVPFTAYYLTPGETVTLQSLSPTGVSAKVATLVADSSGKVSHSWTASATVGVWRFALTDATGVPSPSVYVEVVNDPLRLAVSSSTITLGQDVNFAIRGATRDYRLRLHREGGSTPLADVDLLPDAGGQATYTWAPTAKGTWKFYAYNLSGFRTGWVNVSVVTALPSPTPTPTPMTSPQPSPGLTGVLLVATPTNATVGQTVTLRFTGEAPNSTLNVYKQAPSGVYYMDYPVTDANGTATVTWNTTGWTAGNWTVFSYGPRGYSNRVTVTLAAGYSLATSRTTMPAGSSATLTVSGAAPSAPLTLYRTAPNGVTTTTSLYSGADGKATHYFTTSTRGSYAFWGRNSAGQDTNRVTVYVY